MDSRKLTVNRTIDQIAESPSLTLMAIFDVNTVYQAINSSERWGLGLSCQTCHQVYFWITRKAFCAKTKGEREDIIHHVLDGAIAKIQYESQGQMINQGCKCLELKQKAKAQRLKQMNRQISLNL